jgi:hypothetical protein
MILNANSLAHNFSSRQVSPKPINISNRVATNNRPSSQHPSISRTIKEQAFSSAQVVLTADSLFMHKRPTRAARAKISHNPLNYTWKQDIRRNSDVNSTIISDSVSRFRYANYKKNQMKNMAQYAVLPKHVSETRRVIAHPPSNPKQ